MLTGELALKKISQSRIGPVWLNWRADHYTGIYKRHKTAKHTTFRSISVVLPNNLLRVLFINRLLSTLKTLEYLR